MKGTKLGALKLYDNVYPIINNDIKLSGIPNIAFLLAKNVIIPIATLKQTNFIVVFTGFNEKSLFKNKSTAVIVVTPINVFSEPKTALNPIIRPIITTNIIVFPMIFFSTYLHFLSFNY